MRSVAVISRLYPTPYKPRLGAFNEQQFRRLAERYRISVLVPVPWHEWLRHARKLRPERRGAIDVHYTGWFFPPKVLRTLYPAYFSLAMLPQLPRLRQLAPDCLLLSWAYPDAVGAVLLGRALGIPMIIKAHGRDLKVHASHPLHAMQLRWAVSQCAALMCVSGSLRDLAIELGVPPEKIVVIRNGVDTARFSPMPRAEARAAAGLPADRESILFVGSVFRRKGVHELLDAFTWLARERGNLDLIVIGEGDEVSELRRRAGLAGLADRVRLVGGIAHDQLNVWFNASSLLCVPWHHDNDGLPNVVLEAMAAGIPCVASRVCGIPEAVTDASGVLVEAGDVPALTEGLRKSLERTWDRTAIAAGTAAFSWQASIDGLSELIEGAIAGRT